MPMRGLCNAIGQPLRPVKNAHGITLIMVAAVLAILAALGTGFYTMMLMASKSATRYSDTVRADMMAKAGIEYAIASLRQMTYKKTEDPSDPWYMVDYFHGGQKRISFPDNPLIHNGIDDDNDGQLDNVDESGVDPTKNLPYSRALGNTASTNSDRFTLNISDAASRININATENLAVVLDNLCRVIGAPLVAADQNKTYQRVWEWYGGLPGTNTDDWPAGGQQGQFPGAAVPRNIYFWLYDTGGAVTWDGITKFGDGRPLVDPTNGGRAVYGDGYAIAGYRARHGRFQNIEDVRSALTYVERNGNAIADDPLERLEVEVKFAAIRDFITVDSWVDTNTVCVGKFEWVIPDPNSSANQIAIDRDKSWIPDDPVADPQNKRGSLRGCYLSIINGAGAGQLRRISTNGIDWVLVDQGFAVPPGPTSSYMIVAQEDAPLQDLTGAPVNRPVPYGFPPGVTCFPATNPDSTLVDDPDIDYQAKPLCIHRAPVNINTASDKVLAAVIMGINTSQGNYLSVGTDADLNKLASGDASVGSYGGLKFRDDWTPTDPDWKLLDYQRKIVNGAGQQIPRNAEPYILTPKGMKRIPASLGKISFDVDFKTIIQDKLAALTPVTYNMDYLNNFGAMDTESTTNSTKINEATELAYRIIIARQKDNNYKYIDPLSGAPTATANSAYLRGPFKSWDDLYFRVVKPWDDSRINPKNPDGTANVRFDNRKGSVARLIMACFNSNTDILKFNPNIEWIDRWGRNFTEMEPIMAYTNQAENQTGGSWGHGAVDGNSTPGPLTTCDMDGIMNPDAIPIFCKERQPWTQGASSLFAMGTYGTDPYAMGSYVVRAFRYKADEMIDKTDLNRSTTEFSFDSGGIFDIQSTGQVVQNGSVQAERKVHALVQVYHVWRESTQRQFVQGRIDKGSTAPDMTTASARGTTYSGQVARDANPANDGSNKEFCLPLVTWPEPLVPLNYQISNKDQNAGNEKNREIVDTTLGVDTGGVAKKRDAWGNAIPITTPLITANRVLPAGYDGQIVLATNTSRFDPTGNGNDHGDMDTFLASFNGDLDTNTCNGNGHEQAKTPANCQIQVVDSIGLLGALNDIQVDIDPGLKRPDGGSDANTNTACVADTPPYSGSPISIYRYKTVVQGLRGMNPYNYWNNVVCRQGDLRTEGVHLTNPGMSGNDGTLKYLCGIANGSPSDDPANYNLQNFSLNGSGATRAVGEDYNNRGSAGNVQGWLLTMWAKTEWHHNDERTHEFFDCTTPGWNDNGIRAEAFWLRKMGRAHFAVCEQTNGGIAVPSIYPFEDPTWGVSGAGNRDNDLSFALEPEQDAGDWSDPDWTPYLHGGYSGVPSIRYQQYVNNQPNPQYEPESPAYRVQPFRWHFLGARCFLSQNFAQCSNNYSVNSTSPNHVPSGDGASKRGFWKPNYSPEGWKDMDAVWTATNLFRPFIDSERYPDSPTLGNADDYSPFAKYWTVTQVQGSTGFTAYQNKGRAGPIGYRGDGGQPVRWTWASPGGFNTADGKSINDNPVFCINNCNGGLNYLNAGQFTSIYRALPEEGTNAVIDELKISRKETYLRNPPDPKNDRVTRTDANRPGEATLSRYYLPPDPSDPTQCPTFTSQTMLQSLKGFDKTATGESIVLARLSWTVFTPRFMSEYKRADRTRTRFVRNETITKNYTTSGGPLSSNLLVGTADSPSSAVPFKGPFDYCKYNDLNGFNNSGGFNGVSKIAGNGRTMLPEEPEDFNDPGYDLEPTVFPYRCNRPTPDQYPQGQSQSTKGVEIELLDSTMQPIAGSAEQTPGALDFQPTTTFTNPDALNRFGTVDNPTITTTDQLRYRVRFKYPVDPLADPYMRADVRGNLTVDPAQQYLLDTPVFDDIAVTYFTKPRILEYSEVTE